jgi:hypothetical protein
MMRNVLCAEDHRLAYRYLWGEFIDELKARHNNRASVELELEKINNLDYDLTVTNSKYFPLFFPQFTTG